MTSTDFLKDRAVFQRIYSQMPEYRKRKVDSYRFDRDRRLSLAAGYLLSKALRNAGIREETLRLTTTPNGHPYFENRPDLHFSLSHAGKMAMCALADTPVGCDVEEILGNETVDLYRWTAMESYLKATDGVIDELLTFDPRLETAYCFHEIRRNVGYRYMVCTVSGTNINIHC